MTIFRKKRTSSGDSVASSPSVANSDTSLSRVAPDISHSDLHLKVFTLKYQTEVINGTPHQQAKTNAKEFCTSHFENDSFLQQWLTEAVTRLSDLAKIKENESNPQTPVALQIAHDRTMSCLALGYMLDQWANVGDRLPRDEIVHLPLFEDSQLLSRFTTQEYCKRLGQHIRCSTSTFVVAAALLKRVSKKLGKPFLTSLTHRRMLLTSLLIAVKLCDDEIGSNRFYARLGCVTVDDLNQMESFIMTQLSFVVFVKDEEFERNRRMLEGIIDLSRAELEATRSQSVFKSLSAFVERMMK